VTPKEISERVNARISGWPRPILIAFVVWALIGSFGFFFSIPLAIIFSFFDAPSVLSAGRIRAVVDQYFLLVSFVFGLPMGVLILLTEDRTNWATWRDKLQRGFLGAALAVFIWALGGLSVYTILDGLAVATNAISKSPQQSWSLEILETNLRGSTRGCAKDLYLRDPTVPDHLSKVCVYSLNPLFQAQAGDVVHLKGRYGPFGITYDPKDVRLEKLAQPTN
jgi:hypothetical protein